MKNIIKKTLTNKYIKNSLWLIIDKFFLLFCGLVVTAIVARYLGPEQMGKLSYGLVFSVLCTTISQWGASYTIFNIAVNDRAKATSLISKTLKTRLFIYLLSWSIVSFYLYSTLVYEDFVLVSLVCLSSIFLGLDIYQFYFNATLQSKINAKPSMLAKSITMLMRVFFVLMGLNIYWFIIPLVVEGAIIFYLKYKVLNKEPKPTDDENSHNVYFKSGLLFLSSSVLVFVYSKINQLVLKEYTSFEELGLYSVGLALAGAWVFIPLSIGTSYLTKALKTQKDEDFAFTYLLVLLVSMPIILFIFLASKYVVLFTFGEQYEAVSPILPYMCITTLFGVYGFLNNRHIGSLDNGASYINKKVIVTTLISLILTGLLVAHYGLMGAVISIFIIELLNFTVANYFKKNVNIALIHKKVFKFNNFQKIYRILV
ncbi:hypothetical protein BCT82_03625 [Vibrio breoganii]|uniref:oligosaccharide flippase family protein n=1 Tax=Vibrio breoganii TaxID=553239 RepID=UPI000C81D8C3|nr:oligosaccharide flippase family protein [Vibrio breoganii]PML20706.1 hypothetical protein BCT82_03625 [Vibrio breoganii]